MNFRTALPTFMGLFCACGAGTLSTVGGPVSRESFGELEPPQHPLCERFGLEAIGEIRTDMSPVLTPMVRWGRE